MSPETIKDILKDVESTIGRLYEVYSEKFPELRDFWLSLAEEEKNHARLIMELPSQLGEDKVYYNENRFDPVFAKNSLAYVKQQLDVAKAKDISLKEALSTALHIEKKLVEKAFYAVFDGDEDELKTILLTLDSETRNHRNKLQGALDAS